MTVKTAKPVKELHGGECFRAGEPLLNGQYLPLLRAVEAYRRRWRRSRRGRRVPKARAS